MSTVYAFTVGTQDTRGRTVVRIIAHFEFNNTGRQAAEAAMKAIPNSGFEGPVGDASYWIGREYLAEVEESSCEACGEDGGTKCGAVGCPY